jgi:hypothetical protein
MKVLKGKIFLSNFFIKSGFIFQDILQRLLPVNFLRSKNENTFCVPKY